MGGNEEKIKDVNVQWSHLVINNNAMLTVGKIGAIMNLKMFVCVPTVPGQMTSCKHWSGHSQAGQGTIKQKF